MFFHCLKGKHYHVLNTVLVDGEAVGGRLVWGEVALLVVVGGVVVVFVVAVVIIAVEEAVFAFPKVLVMFIEKCEDVFGEMVVIIDVEDMLFVGMIAVV